MTSIYTLDFWKDAFERAVKTAAQAVIVGVGLGEGFNAFDMDVKLAFGFALGGAILSVLTSVATAPFGTRGTASLTNVVEYKDA